MVNNYSGYSDDSEDEEETAAPLMKSTTILNVNLTMYMCNQTDDADSAETDDADTEYTED